MPRCPECKYCWKTKAKVCDNLIAKTPRKKLKKRQIEYENNIDEFLSKLYAGVAFRTTDLIDYYLVRGKTEGDVYRLICDGWVCKGVLSKTKFSTKGHTYIKNKEIKPCQYFAEGINEKGKTGYACLFDWDKQATEVDVDDVD